MSETPVSFRFNEEERGLLESLKEELGIKEMFGADKRVIMVSLEELLVALRNSSGLRLKELYRRANAPLTRRKGAGRPKKPIIMGGNVIQKPRLNNTGGNK